MAAVANNHMQCDLCLRIQAVPPPRDSADIVRFCLAEWPQRRCMYCCSCMKCMHICHGRDLQLYLGLNDKDFNVYLKRRGGDERAS